MKISKSCQTLLFVIGLCCLCVFGCEEGKQITDTDDTQTNTDDTQTIGGLIPDPKLAAVLREKFGLTKETPLTVEMLQH